MTAGQRSGDDDVVEVTEPARQEPGGAECGTKDGWGFRAAASVPVCAATLALFDLLLSSEMAALFLATTGVTKATGGLDCCFGFSRAWELKKLVIFVPLSLLVLEGGHHLEPLLLVTVPPSLLLVSRSRGGASSPKGGVGALH